MVEMLFTQYMVEKGLKMFGQAGAETVKSEIVQLIEMDIMEPTSKTFLTYKEFGAALPYLIFFKQKRCGRIKGRGCADGQQQRI